MTEQTTPVIETPKRRIRITLPSRSTVAKAGALVGTFALGAVVGAKRVKDACACGPETDEATGPTDN
jgi:hypothetical protein